MARPRRLENFSYKGRHHYFFTILTDERRPAFADAAIVEAASTQLLQSSQAYGMAVDVYCFMPDHVHLLAQGMTESASALEFVADFKHATGWAYRRTRGQRLWREGFHDRVLRDESDALDVTLYIVQNPVRAGLVTSPAEYPFWGSCTRTREEILATMTGGG